MMKQIFKYILLLSAVAVIASCSTTRRLGEDELLYTGVKKVTINVPDTVDIPESVDEAIHTTINVPANNSLYSPYVRSPFPLGLWIYNKWDEDCKGLKGWIYRKFVEQPVLISDVRPDLRMKMVEDALDKNGFFGSTTSYELLINKKNRKKARVNYTINLTVPKRLTEIRYLNDSTDLTKMINGLLKKDKYLVPGSVFCVDSLTNCRNKIADRLRNRGYYYFRPEYVTFKADSTITEGGIVIQMVYSDNIPGRTLDKYKVGKVTTRVYLNKGLGYPDTMMTNRGMVIQMKPSKLRPNLLPSCITFKEGDMMKVKALARTQSYLSRLGIFNTIMLNVPPLDSVKTKKLDVNIDLRFDQQFETRFEANVTSKSNSYLGPGLEVSFTNKNIFGGGERLTFSADGAYEWQIGKVDEGKSRSAFNSYEFGLNVELAFPRLLAPKFLRTTKKDLNWTRISIGGELMNRPHFFKMMQLDLGLDYEWSASRYSRHQLTPFELKYNKLLKTTVEFDQMMEENISIAQSFQNQFIPKLSYTYTFNKGWGHRRKDRQISLMAQVQEAGNLFSGIWSLCGTEGTKELFGTPFSQFVKASVQVVYSHKLMGDHRLVGRLYTGAAHAYGNSSEVPYNEQFYVGGANSLRAFAVRSIGPGSYHSEKVGSSDKYYDQTGNFRFECNLEYRFPILGMLKGAVFVDAGNVWLLKEDTQRPGGKVSKDFFKDLALNTGLGIRFDMGMIVIRGDLGVGLHKPYECEKKGYYNFKKFGDSLAFNLAIGYPF